jgi:phage terminase large subunit GpA-like protein
MLDKGEWRAEAQGDGKTAGFWINGLYSPWVTWAKLASSFVKASRSPERLRVFINTVLAESWQEPSSEKIDVDALMARREPFGETLPAGVALLTVGVDVQADRLEAHVIGWGKDEECWSLAYNIIRGDPTQPEVWRDLDQILTSEFANDRGIKLPISAACIDSGYASASVYNFCKDRLRRRVYAIKGQSGRHPVWPRKASHGKDKSALFMVGVDSAKEWIAAHLRIHEPGPGYMHFPLTVDRTFFEQLTSETIRVRYSKGFAVREWFKAPGLRNEVLDGTCYSFAALQSLAMSGFRLNQYAEKLAEMKAEPEKPSATVPNQPAPQRPKDAWNYDRRDDRGRRGSWLGDTRNWLRR